MPAEPDVSLTETLDVYDSSQTEVEDVPTESGLRHSINRPVFGSPALKLVWENFMQRHETVSRGSRRPLREAVRMVYGPSYGRETAQAVGIWANCENPSFWLRFWFWMQRQGEILQKTWIIVYGPVYSMV
jgi:hypothetical protein